MRLEPTLLEYDYDRSTVTIAGEYRFPAVIPLCPLGDENDDRSERDHSLWTPPTGKVPPAKVQPDFDVWIPTEARFLLHVVEHAHESAAPNNPHLELRIDSLTCELSESDGEPMWLPYSLSLVDGTVMHTEKATVGKIYWDEAEPTWIEEFIGYLVHRPYLYLEPPGPCMRLVHLNHCRSWEETDV